MATSQFQQWNPEGEMIHHQSSPAYVAWLSHQGPHAACNSIPYVVLRRIRAHLQDQWSHILLLSIERKLWSMSLRSFASPADVFAEGFNRPVTAHSPVVQGVPSPLCDVANLCASHQIWFSFISAADTRVG